MLRFLGMIVLLLGAFALGYAWGKRPLADLEHTVKELSRNVVDTTLGIERDLRRRQGLIDAKARIVQAKSDLVNRNHATAAKELGIEGIDLPFKVTEHTGWFGSDDCLDLLEGLSVTCEGGAKRQCND